jgi:hypothetical protein
MRRAPVGLSTRTPRNPSPRVDGGRVRV